MALWVSPDNVRLFRPFWLLESASHRWQHEFMENNMRAILIAEADYASTQTTYVSGVHNFFFSVEIFSAVDPS